MSFSEMIAALLKRSERRPEVRNALTPEEIVFAPQDADMRAYAREKIANIFRVIDLPSLVTAVEQSECKFKARRMFAICASEIDTKTLDIDPHLDSLASNDNIVGTVRCVSDEKLDPYKMADTFLYEVKLNQKLVTWRNRIFGKPIRREVLRDFLRFRAEELDENGQQLLEACMTMKIKTDSRYEVENDGSGQGQKIMYETKNGTGSTKIPRTITVSIPLLHNDENRFEIPIDVVFVNPNENGGGICGFHLSSPFLAELVWLRLEEHFDECAEKLGVEVIHGTLNVALEHPTAYVNTLKG